MNEKIIKNLVDDIVQNNGNGHKNLQEKIDAGEISELIAEMIKLKANLILLESAI